MDSFRKPGRCLESTVVSLSGYTGQVSVRVRLNRNFYLICVDCRSLWTLTTGCTDPFVDNYNVVIDDGSCLYTGCMDPTLTNYCATCNVNDSTLCIYPKGRIRFF